MVQEYIIVYCVYSLIVYLIAILFRYSKSTYISVKSVLVLFILIGSLIAAFRPEATQDTLIYNEAYSNSLYYLTHHRITGITQVFANRAYYNMELLYVILMACFRFFFISPVVFYFVQGFVSNALMIQGLYLLSDYILEFSSNKDSKEFFCKKILLLYALYQLFCGVLYTSSAIRAGFSISLGLFAIASLLNNKRFRLSILFLVLSVLLHTTSIILVFIFIVIKFWKLKLLENYTWVISLTIPILYLIKVGSVFVGQIAKLVEKVLLLLNIQAFYSYLSNFDYQLPKREGFILVLTCFIFLLIQNDSLKKNNYFLIVIIGLVLYTFAYPIPALARLLYPFILFMIPLTMVSNSNEKYIYLFWSLYFIPQYIYVFSYL